MNHFVVWALWKWIGEVFKCLPSPHSHCAAAGGRGGGRVDFRGIYMPPKSMSIIPLLWGTSRRECKARKHALFPTSFPQLLHYHRVAQVAKAWLKHAFSPPSLLKTLPWGDSLGRESREEGRLKCFVFPSWGLDILDWGNKSLGMCILVWFGDWWKTHGNSNTILGQVRETLLAGRIRFKDLKILMLLFKNKSRVVWRDKVLF